MHTQPQFFSLTNGEEAHWWPTFRRWFAIPSLFLIMLTPPAFLSGCTVKACQEEAPPPVAPPDFIYFGSPQDPINLVMWYTFEDSRVMEGLAAEYQALHPHVTITTIPQRPFDEYIDQLGLKSGTSSAPDIYFIRNDWLPLYSGKLRPMAEKNLIRNPDSSETFDEYVDLFPPAVRQDFLVQETVVNPTTGTETVESDLYGIPWGHEGVALFVNLDHIDQYNRANPTDRIPVPIPTETISWEDFFAMSQKLIKTQDGWLDPNAEPVFELDEIEHFGAAFGNSTNVQHFPEMLSTLIMQKNVQLVADDRQTVNFIRGNNITSTVRAVEQFVEYNNYWSADFSSSLEAFAQGTVSLAFGKSFQLPGIEARNLNVEVIPIPQRNPSDPTTWVTPSYYWARVVNSDTEYPLIAWDFVKWAASQDRMKFYAESTQIPPARLDLADPDGEVTVTMNSNRYDPFLRSVPYAQSWYKGNYEDAEQAMRQMIIDVNNGEDVQDAVTVFATELEGIVQDYQIEEFVE